VSVFEQEELISSAVKTEYGVDRRLILLTFLLWVVAIAVDGIISE
jgi:hypothetical protein